MEVETATGTQLPKDTQIPSQTQKKDISDNKDVYTVEKVLDKKVENGQKLYLIKWEGYPTSQSTWEPVENLLSVIDIIVEYEVRECTRQEEKEHAKEDDSPNKRKADRSLSEEEVVKKVKGDSSEAKEKPSRKESHEDDDDEDEEEDEDESEEEEERETMQEKLNRRKKHLSRLKAFQGKEYKDQETLAKVSKNINMAHPFVIETVKEEDLEASESEEDDDELSDVPKKKRGRPRKYDKVKEGVVRKRGRPRKIRPEGADGEEQVKKRGPGRPRKHPAEEEEGEPKEVKPQEGPRKRGRPRKIVTTTEEKDEEEIEEEGKENNEAGEAGEAKEVKEAGDTVAAAPKKRGRPRKEVQYKEIEENEESEEEHAEGKESKAEKEEGKEEGEKMETEEKEGEEKDEKGEDKETEGASPTAFLKARKESVLKRRGLPLKTSDSTESKPDEGKVSAESVVKRGRGRPRKNRDAEPASAASVGPEEEEKEKEKGDEKKENNEATEEKEGMEHEKEEKEGEDEEGEEEGSEEEEEEDEDKPRSQPARKRGRPPKSQQKKRGRPKKQVRVTREDEEHMAPKDNNGDEISTAPRKRGRPRKVVADVNKENDYQAGIGKNDQEDQAATNILGVRSQSTEGESNQKNKAANAHKFGSLNEKDIPVKIIKARVVTDKGCIFLIEWEKRPNGDQPQNSHVTSHELKNFDPSFLLEYYEEILKKNLKTKASAPKVEIEPRDEDMIPVEQNPELFGSFAFHDNPKEVIKVQSADQDGWEFLVRWEPRDNNIQPLDSVVNNEALKLHDPNCLIAFYESKIKANPGEDANITLDILDPEDEKETEHGESAKNEETPAGETGVNNNIVNETVMQQEPVASTGLTV